MRAKCAGAGKLWWSIGLGLLAALLLCCTNGGRAAAGTISPAPPAGETLTITQADNGQTFHIQVGDRVVVKMGTGLDWSVDVEPPGILVPVPGAGTLARGVQAIYVAAQPGTATITATGRPICSAGSVCPQFIVLVRVTIVVDGPAPAGGSGTAATSPL